MGFLWNPRLKSSVFTISGLRELFSSLMVTHWSRECNVVNLKQSFTNAYMSKLKLVFAKKLNNNRYSVFICTVEFLSLLYLLVISWLICSRRWFVDKLGVFHANQISVSWSTSEIRVRFAPWNRFKPSNNILLTVPRRGQVWYLIVSIPDLCTLTYFNNWQNKTIKIRQTDP